MHLTRILVAGLLLIGVPSVVAADDPARLFPPDTLAFAARWVPGLLRKRARGLAAHRR